MEESLNLIMECINNATSPVEAIRNDAQAKIDELLESQKIDFLIGCFILYQRATNDFSKRKVATTIDAVIKILSAEEGLQFFQGNNEISFQVANDMICGSDGSLNNIGNEIFAYLLCFFPDPSNPIFGFFQEVLSTQNQSFANLKRAFRVYYEFLCVAQKIFDDCLKQDFFIDVFNMYYPFCIQLMGFESEPNDDFIGCKITVYKCFNHLYAKYPVLFSPEKNVQTLGAIPFSFELPSDDLITQILQLIYNIFSSFYSEGEFVQQVTQYITDLFNIYIGKPELNLNVIRQIILCINDVANFERNYKEIQCSFLPTLRPKKFSYFQGICENKGDEWTKNIIEVLKQKEFDSYIEEDSIENDILICLSNLSFAAPNVVFGNSKEIVEVEEIKPEIKLVLLYACIPNDIIPVDNEGGSLIKTALIFNKEVKEWIETNIDIIVEYANQQENDYLSDLAIIFLIKFIKYNKEFIRKPTSQQSSENFSKIIRILSRNIESVQVCQHVCQLLSVLCKAINNISFNSPLTLEFFEAIFEYLMRIQCDPICSENQNLFSLATNAMIELFSHSTKEIFEKHFGALIESFYEKIIKIFSKEHNGEQVEIVFPVQEVDFNFVISEMCRVLSCLVSSPYGVDTSEFAEGYVNDLITIRQAGDYNSGELEMTILFILIHSQDFVGLYESCNVLDGIIDPGIRKPDAISVNSTCKILQYLYKYHADSFPVDTSEMCETLLELAKQELPGSENNNLRIGCLIETLMFILKSQKESLDEYVLSNKDATREIINELINLGKGEELNDEYRRIYSQFFITVSNSIRYFIETYSEQIKSDLELEKDVHDMVFMFAKRITYIETPLVYVKLSKMALDKALDMIAALLSVTSKRFNARPNRRPIRKIILNAQTRTDLKEKANYILRRCLSV